MDQLATLFANNSVSVIYYILMTAAAIFMSGWYLNNKLKVICEESNKDLVSEMNENRTRIEKLEANYTNKETHDRDLNAIHGRLNQIQIDIREGFAAQAARIDQLFQLSIR